MIGHLLSIANHILFVLFPTGLNEILFLSFVLLVFVTVSFGILRKIHKARKKRKNIKISGQKYKKERYSARNKEIKQVLVNDNSFTQSNVSVHDNESIRSTSQVSSRTKDNEVFEVEETSIGNIAHNIDDEYLLQNVCRKKYKEKSVSEQAFREIEFDYISNKKHTKNYIKGNAKNITGVVLPSLIYSQSKNISYGYPINYKVKEGEKVIANITVNSPQEANHVIRNNPAMVKFTNEYENAIDDRENSRYVK